MDRRTKAAEAKTDRERALEEALKNLVDAASDTLNAALPQMGEHPTLTILRRMMMRGAKALDS